MIFCATGPKQLYDSSCSCHKSQHGPLMVIMAGAGLSRSLEANTIQVAVGNQIGTVAYTAPEIFRDSFVTKPSDVYAFGILSTSPAICLTWHLCMLCHS